jgi:hypothetical protein
MPQNVFDSLVIVRAMSNLAKDDNIVREAIKEYVSIYPDENAQELEKDINEAVITAWDATNLMLKLRPPKSNEADPKIVYALLNSLNEAIKEIAVSDNSSPNVLWFHISRFRSSPPQNRDRVATCKKHVSLACQQALRESFDSYHLRR